MIAIGKNRNPQFGIFTFLFILAAVFSVVSEQYYLVAIPFIILFFYYGWRNINLVFLLLLFSLPFSAEYQVTSTLGMDFPDELLMLSVALLFGYYWIYKPAVLSKESICHPLAILLLLSYGWAGLSSYFSTYPALSLKFLLAKIWYFGAFVLAPLVIFREKQWIQKSIMALVTAMSLVTLITLARHCWYGFTFASINDALYPFFRNHVNYSSLLVCILPVVYVYMRTTDQPKLKSAARILLTVLLVALFLSYARGAWLALIAGVSAAWLIKKRLLTALYAGVVIVSLAFFFWIKSGDRYLQFAHDYRTTVWHSDFSDHLAATYQLKDVSTAERFYRWIAGVRMINDNWLTGYGPNSFYYNYRPYTIPAFRTWVSNNPEHSTVHNYFLLLAIEQGIPGLIFFLLLSGAMLYYAQSLYHKVRDIFYKQVAMVTGVVVVMILTVNLLSDLIETDKIGSVFFLCLSLLIITDRKARQKNSVGF